MIDNKKKRSSSKWYQSIPNFLENKINKKKFEKKFMLGRDLVNTSNSLNSKPIELRVVSIDSECYRECPEQKKILGKSVVRV